jgi:hypothetical protein
MATIGATSAPGLLGGTGAASTEGRGGAIGGSGTLPQATSVPKIAADARRRQRERTGKRTDMWVILLEALGALLVLVAIVWWTMFAGRRKGERKGPDEG